MPPPQPPIPRVPGRGCTVGPKEWQVEPGDRERAPSRQHWRLGSGATRSGTSNEDRCQPAPWADERRMRGLTRVLSREPHPQRGAGHHVKCRSLLCPGEQGDPLAVFPFVEVEVTNQGLRTTRHSSEMRLSSDLAKREIAASLPDRPWAAGVTFVPSWVGFLSFPFGRRLREAGMTASIGSRGTVSTTH